MVTPSNPHTKAGGLGQVIAQLLGWLICIVISSVVTAIAPVSWIKFQRQGDRLTAHADVCLFFIIPYRIVTIDPVTSVGDRTQSGSVNRYRRSGKPDQYIRSESEGFLLIQGPYHEDDIPVTPADIQSVVMKSEAFLKDPQAAELKLFVVANWKFSVIGGKAEEPMAGPYV